MMMNDTRTGKKEKHQHIQVSVRVRPINNIERNSNSKEIIEIPNNKELIVHEHAQDKFSKKFKFDNVFGPSSKQIDVYNAVVSPLLEQVLAGYNCTVLAYGQTGTGKTFTMEGINRDSTLHWRSDSSAGIIPRSLNHLFDALQLPESPENRIRVSFLELYNEELFDLLSTNDDSSKIRLYEDTSKKGAVIINGLEEVTVHNKSEVYRILEKGLERRQTAATLMNAHSSRSHTLFSITIHMKENTVDGEEVLKTGKLNLVDLAGSENVGRSGAVDRRAREAGNVNQSLLTLGRVITALVERAPHIPYRESKLTRLLQESLGGCTKTSIIATVSPASSNIEESLSTLDYAHRAKNITNRPERNQRLSKKEFLKQYTEEIERLKRDLLATRERNGVFLATDNYNEMQALIAQQSKEIEEKINQIKTLEKSMQDMEKVYNDLKLENINREKELTGAKTSLNNVIEALNSTTHRLKVTAQERDEQKYLVEKHVSTEQALLSQAQNLLNVADTAAADSEKLHDKIHRKTKAEQRFESLSEQFKNNFQECVEGIKKDISAHGEKLELLCSSMKKDIVTQLLTKNANTSTEVQQISNDLTDQYSTGTNNITKDINDCYSSYEDWLKDEIKNAAGTVELSDELLNAMAAKLAENIDSVLDTAIADNLIRLRANLHKKLEQTATRLNEMIASACKRDLEAYNSIKKKIEYVKTNVARLRTKQEFTEKQRVFAQVMEKVSFEFQLLRESQRKHYETVANKCDRVSKICEEVGNRSTCAHNTIAGMRNNLKEQIASGLQEIENTVITEAKKNEELANNTTERGKILLNEVKSGIRTSCDVTKQYQNLVECNFKEVQRTMDVDKNEYLSAINDMQKTVASASKDHEIFAKNQESKTRITLEEISGKLQNRITESNTRNASVIEKITGTVGEINKFFDEDVQRDVPTGSTPARKEFSYPRQFTVTSPHERILQRFREVRKTIETSEDEDDTIVNNEVTLDHIVNSTAVSDATFTLSPTESTISATSTLSTNSVAKQLDVRSSIDSHPMSPLNISAISVQSNISSTSTETSTKKNDKENDDFLIPEKTKDARQSKLRKPRRKVLGSDNW